MRKTIFLLLLAALLAAIPALADTDGDFEYVLLDDGTCKITGYTGPGGDLIIPSTLGGYPVSVVGGIIDIQNGVQYDVFEGNKRITSLTVSEGVRTIGNYAFKDCSNMQALSLPSSLERIEAFAFAWCSALTEITIPGNVAFVGESAFTGIFSLESLTIEADHPTLYQNPFTYARKLTQISAPAGRGYVIVDGALVRESDRCLVCPAYGLLPEAYTLPDEVEKVEELAFFGCRGVKSVALPGSVREIGFGSFSSCEDLTAFTAEDGLETVGAYALGGCLLLEDVTLPGTGTVIDGTALSGCSGNLRVSSASQAVRDLCEAEGIAHD